MACNPTKYLAEDEALHAKNTVEIHQTEEEFVEEVSKNEVKSIIRPKPNSKFLGTRLPQYLYYSILDGTDEDSLSNFNRFIFNTFTSKPILLDSTLVEESIEDIRTYLFNNGYFNSRVTAEIDVKNKLSTSHYTLTPGSQHRYDNAYFEYSDSLENIKEIIETVSIENYIKKGDNYDVEDFQKLRQELVNEASEIGFYRFNKGSIYIEPDTLATPGKVDIYAVIENPEDSLFNQKFYIRNIYVDIGRGLTDNYFEPVAYNDKLFSNSEIVKVKPKVLDRFILFSKDEPYSSTKFTSTINKLFDLPIVRYANIEFKEIIEQDSLKLDAFISITANPLMKVSIEPQISEFQGLGLSADLSFSHRNIFNGGEHFELSINGGVESAQRQNESTKIFGTSYINVEPKITFPRLLVLDKIFDETYLNTINQSTQIHTRFGYQNRVGLYRFREYSFGQIWDWQNSPHNRHQLSLVDVSLIQVPYLSRYYKGLLNQYPSNAYSFENRIILGNRYTYTYSDRLKRPDKSYMVFTGTVESAGNLAYLISGKASDTLRIGNTDVARYVRSILDYQYNFKVSSNSYLVTRLNTAIAMPIGDVKSIPAVKQFYVGGSNSLRAWQPRSLGPGSFDFRQTGIPEETVDQRGDVKLEANIEYRFPFTKLFGQQIEGAIFTDAGNIWSLYEPDVTDGGRENAELNREFYRQVAVGSGVGLRLKIQNLFTVRTDLAFKIRDPLLAEGNRWVETPFGFDNSNFVVGIGYPF